jgi:hypothetical protein
MIRSKSFWFWMIVLLALVVWLIIDQSKHHYFKRTQFSENNIVINYTKYPYIDTIVYIGLDSLGMCDMTVTVKRLSEEAKANFPSDLEVRGAIYGDGHQYVMYVTDASRSEHINIVAHELIHLRQFYSKQLVYDGWYVYWNRAKYDLKEIEYGMRPWEADAFQQEVDLERRIKSVLY